MPVTRSASHHHWPWDDNRDDTDDNQSGWADVSPMGSGDESVARHNGAASNEAHASSGHDVRDGPSDAHETRDGAGHDHQGTPADHQVHAGQAGDAHDGPDHG